MTSRQLLTLAVPLAALLAGSGCAYHSRPVPARPAYSVTESEASRIAYEYARGQGFSQARVTKVQLLGSDRWKVSLRQNAPDRARLRVYVAVYDGSILDADIRMHGGARGWHAVEPAHRGRPVRGHRATPAHRPTPPERGRPAVRPGRPAEPDRGGRAVRPGRPAAPDRAVRPGRPAEPARGRPAARPADRDDDDDDDRGRGRRGRPGRDKKDKDKDKDDDRGRPAGRPAR